MSKYSVLTPTEQNPLLQSASSAFSHELSRYTEESDSKIRLPSSITYVP